MAWYILLSLAVRRPVSKPSQKARQIAFCKENTCTRKSS